MPLDPALDPSASINDRARTAIRLANLEEFGRRAKLNSLYQRFANKTYTAVAADRPGDGFWMDLSTGSLLEVWARCRLSSPAPPTTFTIALYINAVSQASLLAIASGAGSFSLSYISTSPVAETGVFTRGVNSPTGSSLFIPWNGAPGRYFVELAYIYQNPSTPANPITITEPELFVAQR